MWETSKLFLLPHFIFIPSPGLPQKTCIMRTLILLLFMCYGSIAQQGLGINTTNPQKELHLGSINGTLRIENLNSTNNSFNGGDANGNTLDDDFYPLYVDENGDFHLDLEIVDDATGLDELDDTLLPGSAVSMTDTDADGIVTTTITSFSVTTTRAAILEVKYNVSFDVYEDNVGTIITDNNARRIKTYLNINGQSREYGPATKCYSSGSSNSSVGIMYNNCTAYISIPSSGSWTISLMGAVSSDIRSGGGPGGPSLDTHVQFATGNDKLLMRLH